MHILSSGTETALWFAPLFAFGISFFTSMGGVSGAFLLLPFQITFLGNAAPSASATNHLYNVIAIPLGVYRYCREGRVIWPLACIVVAGTLPGVFLGGMIRVTCLPDPRNIKLFAAAVLLCIALNMIRGLLRGNAIIDRAKSVSHRSAASPSVGRVEVVSLRLKQLILRFQGERFCVSTIAVFALGFLVGIAGGIYGIGGGSILAPCFVVLFGLPVYAIAGTALLSTFITSVAGVAVYQLMAPGHAHIAVAPDWILGGLFGLGGMAGIYLGARCQRYVPATAIRWMLTVILLIVAAKYIAAFFG